MATAKQELGAWGEATVAKMCDCPRCKRKRTLKRLPTNFKCADVICDFCGYVAQVKCASSTTVETLPIKLIGAAWGPQLDRMTAGIFIPLFLVLKDRHKKVYSIHYLSGDLQKPDMFLKRRPLSKSARRSGWEGFMYDLNQVKDRVVRIM